MRIAQVAPLTEAVPPKLYGGTERVIHWLTEELVALGHDVTLFASGDSRTSAKLEAVLAARAAARRLGARSQCAAHADAGARAPARTATSISCTSISTTIRSRCSPASRRRSSRRCMAGSICRSTSRCSTRSPSVPVVSISNAQRRPLPQARWVRTIHHGLPERLLTPQPVKPSYFAFLGRIAPEKRVDRAIRIARALRHPAQDRRQGRHAPTATITSEKIVRCSIMHRRRIYRRDQRRTRNPAFLSGAIALLVPIDWPEPFGLVMIEAMACGTPVIAFNRGSVPEVVDDGVTGFIVEDEIGAIGAVDRLSQLSRAKIRAAVRGALHGAPHGARLSRGLSQPDRGGAAAAAAGGRRSPRRLQVAAESH